MMDFSPLATLNSPGLLFIYIGIAFYLCICSAIGFLAAHNKHKGQTIFSLSPQLSTVLIGIFYTLFFIIFLIPFILGAALWTLIGAKLVAAYKRAGERNRRRDSLDGSSVFIGERTLTRSSSGGEGGGEGEGWTVQQIRAAALAPQDPPGYDGNGIGNPPVNSDVDVERGEVVVVIPQEPPPAYVPTRYTPAMLSELARNRDQAAS
ncbi:uncharacterized protein F4822DRAFT_268104 [Hypoxylon trugodes]|uniref:uncharacterized protein n=1 Tax=Hypoxylon trugodes TaxID=326681 RepID=UPI002193F07E|nr:uncharacterized protein F4822DRAFT_268104 [Hypoxylon trugodes]KAI1389057.1 hypothetical protein F4822DRAFT_268104 [Hypoxylon trugodes]